MPLRFVDGFDHYGNTADIMTKWTHNNIAVPASTLYISNATGTYVSANSGFYAGGTSLVRWIGYAPGFANSTWTMGFALKRNSTTFRGKSQAVAGMADAAIVDANWQVGLILNENGKLDVCRSSGGATEVPGNVVLASSTKALVPHKWNYIEWMVTCNNTTGNTEVRVNGETWISATGLDTQKTGNNTMSHFVIGALNPVSTTPYQIFNFDDFYLKDDATFLGPLKIVTRIPSTGNGAMAEFTTSTGSDHGALVDEIPQDGNTTYNYSSTANTIDTYAYPTIGTAQQVHGIQVNSMLLNTNSTAITATTIARANSVNYEGTNTSPTTTYVYVEQMFETNPNTGNAWTATEVDDAEFGIKLF